MADREKELTEIARLIVLLITGGDNPAQIESVYAILRVNISGFCESGCVHTDGCEKRHQEWLDTGR